jgi:hypothetical protein
LKLTSVTVFAVEETPITMLVPFDVNENELDVIAPVFPKVTDIKYS